MKSWIKESSFILLEFSGMLKTKFLLSVDLIDDYDFNTKMIKTLIKIKNYLPCNILAFNPMKIRNYSSMISLRPF